MAKDFPLLIDLLDFSTSFFLIFIDELAESAEAIVQVCSSKLLACFYDIYFHGFFCKLWQNFTPSLSPEFSATRDLVYSPQEIQSEIECVFPMKNRKKVNAFDKKEEKGLSLREV